MKKIIARLAQIANYKNNKTKRIAGVMRANMMAACVESGLARSGFRYAKLSKEEKKKYVFRLARAFHKKMLLIFPKLGGLRIVSAPAEKRIWVVGGFDCKKKLILFRENLFSDKRYKTIGDIARLVAHEYAHYLQYNFMSGLPRITIWANFYTNLSCLIPYKERVLEKHARFIGGLVEENFESDLKKNERIALRSSRMQ